MKILRIEMNKIMTRRKNTKKVEKRCEEKPDEMKSQQKHLLFLNVAKHVQSFHVGIIFMILTPVFVIAHSLYHHLIVPALSRALHWRLCQRDQCLLKARRSGCRVPWFVWVDGGNAWMMDQYPFENQTLVQQQYSHMGLCVLMATGFREAESHQQGWAWLHSEI